MDYNKVLLRERKRHTDRGVSSTLSVNRDWVPPQQGYPQARSDGGLPEVGYPLAGVPQQGYPPLPQLGYPPGQVRWGGTQGVVAPLAGVPPARSDGGYPRWGTPWPGVMGGIQGGVTPGRGTPWPGLMGSTQGGVPRIWTWPGYPLPQVWTDRRMDGRTDMC